MLWQIQTNGVIVIAEEATNVTKGQDVKEKIQLAYFAAMTDNGGSKYDLEQELNREFGDNYQIDDSNTFKWVITADNESVEVPPLVPIEICTITFDSNGGTGIMQPQNVPCNFDIALVENRFEKENQAFNGWNTMPDGSGDSYSNKQNIDIDRDITLYAQWRDRISTEVRYGKYINDKMKTLTSGDLTKIEYIKKADSIEDKDKKSSNNIAKSGEIEVYLFWSDSTIWYYTEADDIYLDEDGSMIFNNLTSVKSIDVCFKTDNCTTFKQTFYNCNALESLDVSGFNTANCQIMTSMFGNCTTLQKLDLGSFNTEKVENTDNMFNGSTNITELNVSSFYTPRLTSMLRMFSSLKSLKVLDISNMDTSEVTNMEKCMDNMDELTTIYVGTGFITTKASKSSKMFNNDLKLVGGNGTVYDSTKINKIYAVIDSPDAKGYFTDISQKPNGQ